MPAEVITAAREVALASHYGNTGITVDPQAFNRLNRALVDLGELPARPVIEGDLPPLLVRLRDGRPTVNRYSFAVAN